MSNPTPSIRVKVDVTNPGQFFACSGLLELADRLWPGAEGWFERAEFCISCGGTLRELLDAFVALKLANTMTQVQCARLEALTAMGGAERKKSAGLEEEKKSLEKLRREEPLLLEGKRCFQLDWFTDDLAGGSRFKTWAGQQSVLEIARSMKAALENAAWRNENCLTYTVAKGGLPFNFDSDLGGQGGAVDVGFSFDPLAASALTRIESTARPALELLAFVGLQRFRPREIPRENRFVYTAWSQPLPIEVAMPVVCGAMPSAGASCFEFRLLYRTKYLKSFLPAIPFTGGPDE